MNDFVILPSGSFPIVPVEQHHLTVPQIEVANLIGRLFPKGLDHDGINFADPLEARENIVRLERAMERVSDLQFQIKTTHTFINGVYAREVFIPKGTLLVGRFHKHACISIMNSGEKSTVSEFGAMRIKAPFATVSPPGIKRVGYAHEDTIWTTIHATDERDLKKLEEELFCDRIEDVPPWNGKLETFVTAEGKICRL